MGCASSDRTRSPGTITDEPDRPRNDPTGRSGGGPRYGHRSPAGRDDVGRGLGSAGCDRRGLADLDRRRRGTRLPAPTGGGRSREPADPRVPASTAVGGITVHAGDGTLDGGSATTGALPSNCSSRRSPITSRRPGRSRGCSPRSTWARTRFSGLATRWFSTSTVGLSGTDRPRGPAHLAAAAVPRSRHDPPRRGDHLHRRGSGLRRRSPG